ncbi:MAG: sigma-70 family RNA polymerase sigma factor [Thermoflexales bacterium]|nr:sigma-70 family RNA polymerase sigma factor [Thermoflexales bacterium]
MLNDDPLVRVERDEQAFIARLKAGDEAACAACIEAHSPMLYRLALRLTGDPAEAEDVLQDTFLSAFRNLHTFDGRSALGTWLYRIAHNAALMRLRKRRLLASLDDLESDDALPLISDAKAPDELIAEQETAEALTTAIMALPQSLREVFVLREVEERSTAETARLLQISEGAVKTRLHRARQALRRLLTDQPRRAALSQRTSSLACTEALRFLESAERRGHTVSASLKQALRDAIAACDRCRLLLDPAHRAASFLCGEKPNPVPPQVQRALYLEVRGLLDKVSREP